jgi:hypothetical protein
MNRGYWILPMLCVLGNSQETSAERNRELRVHLAQANNHSPYAFVRARFEPRELTDP